VVPLGNPHFNANRRTAAAGVFSFVSEANNPTAGKGLQAAVNIA
jgi:hypothetical protein